MRQAAAEGSLSIPIFSAPAHVLPILINDRPRRLLFNSLLVVPIWSWEKPNQKRLFFSFAF